MLFPYVLVFEMLQPGLARTSAEGLKKRVGFAEVRL